MFWSDVGLLFDALWVIPKLEWLQPFFMTIAKRNLVREWERSKRGLRGKRTNV